ncbi:MAG: hypothetical protein AB7E70_18070 [Hyphomicrobiaceae bacterium]
MLANSSSFVQSLTACIVVAYVVFCFLYGYASLKTRRAAAARNPGPATSSASANLGTARWGKHLAMVLGVLLTPAALLAALLSLASRERAGIVEAYNLFVVPYRADAAPAYLADRGRIGRQQVVARFSSDTHEHRLAARKARWQELVASREALKTAPLLRASDLVLKVQTEEQRLTQIEQRLAELTRSSFSLSQQMIATHTTWQNARNDLAARLPTLEASIAAQTAELAQRARHHARIAKLQSRGFATVTQLDQAALAKALAQHALKGAVDGRDKTTAAIAMLDDGQRRTEALLRAEIAKVAGEIAAYERRRQPVLEVLAEARTALEHNKVEARRQRKHELEAATARITALEKELAILTAQSEVKSPISGRVIYRSEMSSALTGSLPLLVVASQYGFVMRLDMLRDELAGLKQEMYGRNTFDVVIDDGSTRRLVKASIVRIDDRLIDRKRVTVAFGLDVPDDMLVRMALKGTTPRAHLRWNPSTVSVLRSRVAQIFKLFSGDAAVASEPRPAKPTAQTKPQSPTPVRVEFAL